MPRQSEKQLEDNLIVRLQKLGFVPVSIMNEDLLYTNLLTQLEKFNQTTFSDREFEKILTHLNKGDRFEKAKILRDRFELERDNGEVFYVRFFNMDHWCENEYQVAHQITQNGRYENRYDVTLLINGLPLVQIELKRRGVEMKEAFNQIQRYQKHSFTGTLFEFAQIFIISNGVNTKYFANNLKQNFEQTFFWTDEKNNKITSLDEFADVFLEKCQLSQMIAQYIVLSEARQMPMILRPYQYYAVKAIVKRVTETNKNGYIWHTTGSGKTLTAYKTSQILSKMKEVEKVLFVVDRKDLDIQTIEEFNAFAADSVDGTDNTRSLVKQLRDKERKLIVTTIQKLNQAVSNNRYVDEIGYLQEERLVIIFDECHRSQFGQTRSKIENFFHRAQLFGFTGTPIFADNNVDGVTTKDIFADCLHKYVITNAISDNNVLGFAIEYLGRYKNKEDDTVHLDIETDEMVTDIDKKEVLESDERLAKIADYVLSDWKLKTKNGAFNAIFAVANVLVLKKYYALLNEKKPADFKLATIFTYQANEDDNGDLGSLEENVFDDNTQPINQHSRDFLDECIKNYNTVFETNFSSETFYDYYKDVQKRIKRKEIDLVLVVNMFLTGFDSPRLNTLYLDKNLRYHGLIQAFSRTNRLLDSSKPHGNIVTFRNLKENVDKALELFGDENAKEIVFKKPYEIQKNEFVSKIQELKKMVPRVKDVDSLRSETEKAAFAKTFRNLLRLKASLETFAQFSFTDLGIQEQEFYDYQSKYLDIYETRKNNENDKESILDEIDFELELMSKDVVNYDYIIQLIIGLHNTTSGELKKKKTDEIMRALDRDVHLRKKKDLIKKFIEESLPAIKDHEQVEKSFNQFWENERIRTLNDITKNDKVTTKQLEKLVGEYLYTQRLPLDQDIVDEIKPNVGIFERIGLVKRIKKAMIQIAEVFEW